MEGAVVLAGIPAFLAALAWLAWRAKRRGTAGAALAGAMAAYDEGWHSTAFDSYIEMQTQAGRVAPRESPDDL
jgi:hypothetical protein